MEAFRRLICLQQSELSKVKPYLNGACSFRACNDANTVRLSSNSLNLRPGDVQTPSVLRRNQPPDAENSLRKIKRALVQIAIPKHKLTNLSLMNSLGYGPPPFPSTSRSTQQRYLHQSLRADFRFVGELSYQRLRCKFEVEWKLVECEQFEVIPRLGSERSLPELGHSGLAAVSHPLLNQPPHGGKLHRRQG
jgi:hypothetical protein